MKALIVLLGLVDRVLQWIVPPIADRVAYTSEPDYADNAFHVFRHALRTRNDLEHVWLLRDDALRGRITQEFEQTVRDAGTRGNRLRLGTRSSLAGYWLYLRSRCVFHTHGAYRFRRHAWRRHIVCVWHGMPIKRIALLDRATARTEYAFGTMHLATSRFFRDIIAAAFGVAPGVVKLCSLPRCDALLDADAVQTPRPAVRARLELPEGRRLVLWMPTYRAEGAVSARPRSFLDDLPAGTLEALDAAAAATGSVVVTKLHPLDPLNPSAPDWRWRHLQLLRASDWAATGIQLYDLIAASDALISDVSSVLIDYLATGRPIGILGFDPATYTRELAFPIERLLATGRFDVLDVPAKFEAFLRRRDTNHGATFLHDAFEHSGSEQILREVGI